MVKNLKIKDSIFITAIIIIFIALTLINPESNHSQFKNFDPLPDSFEYASLAFNIYNGHGPYLTINNVDIPSRYPIGYPLTIIPCYILFGNNITSAYYSSIIFGTLTVFIFFLLARSLFDDSAVVRWATFFFSTSTLILIYSSLVSSEACTLFLLVLALFLTLKTGASNSLLIYSCIGLTIGYAGLVRLPNFLFIIPVLLFLLMKNKFKIFSVNTLALLFPLLLFVVLIGLYNNAVYGLPWKTGYSIYTPGTVFALEYFFPNALSYFFTTFFAIGGHTIWVQGPFFSFIVPIFFFTGLYYIIKERKNETIILFVGLFIPFYFLYSFYFFNDYRFLIILLPLLLLVASVGSARIQRVFPKKFRYPVIVAFGLIYLFQPFTANWNVLYLVKTKFTNNNIPTNFINVQEINSYMDRIKAKPETHFVISALNMVYHDHFSNHKYKLMPLAPSQEYARSKEVRVKLNIPNVDELLNNNCSVFVTDYNVMGFENEYKDEFLKLGEKFKLTVVLEYLYGNCKLYRLQNNVD